MGAICDPLEYEFFLAIVSGDHDGSLNLFCPDCRHVLLRRVNDLFSAAFLSVLTANFVSGVIPLVQRWGRELIVNDTSRQDRKWAKAATIYVLAQAIGGYGYCAVLIWAEVIGPSLPSAPPRSESLLPI